MAKSSIKGINIEIGGDVTPLQKALSGVNETTKNLQGELRQVDNLLKLDPGNVDLLKQKQELLTNSIENTSEKLNTLKNSQADVQKQFESGNIAEEQYRAFQRELIKTESELGKLKNSTEENNSALEKTSGKFKDAEKGTAEFSDELKKSSETADDAGSKFDKLGSVMGTVGAVFAAGVTAIGAAAVASTKALADLSVSGAVYADDLLTISAQTGMSTDALQEYSYAADLVDVSLETLTSSMAKQVKSMSSVQEGSADGSTKMNAMTEAYNKLGVSVYDAEGNMRDGLTVYWELIDALGDVSNETERDAIAMQIFGKSARDLTPLINAGSAGVAELAAEARAMGAVLSEESLNAFGEFDDSIQRLTQGTGAAQRALGGVLLPQLTELADVGVSLLGEFTSGMNDANGDMSKIGDVVSGVLSSAISAITEMLPEFINYGLEIVDSIVSAIGDNLPALISAATDIIITLSEKLIDMLPDIIKAGLEILLALVEGISDALPELIPAAVETILAIVDALIDNIDMLVDAAIEITLALADGLITALPKLIEKAPEIIIKLVSALIENAPKLLSAGIELVVTLVKGIADSLPKIASAAGDIVKNLWEKIKSTDWLQLGKDIISGLLKGLASMGTAIWDAVKGVGNSIVGGFKDFFGIKSPSALMRDQVGSFLADGIAVGFVNEMDKVSIAMQKAIPTKDLLKINGLSLPQNNVVSEISNRSYPAASPANYKIENRFDVKFTGDITNDTLPEVKKILNDIPNMVTKRLTEQLSSRGIKNGALIKSF